jgi:4-amino-4-deoxychorismate lyase
MSLLIESICILNGEIRNLDYHQKRLNKSRYKVLGKEDDLDLNQIIKIPHSAKEGKFKCRILYGEKLESIEFLPYSIRPIQSIRLVENNSIEYKYKYENRSAFELMKDSVSEDEIMILKKGQITDTSYSNLVFFDGDNWITPSTYLLNGTMRQALLREGKVIEDEINPKDFNRFLSFKLINAMMNLEESPELDISIIH